jgi:4-hydroxyphenylpyruvate dioxygenase
MPNNPLRLKSIHHVEFWVGNAKQAAHYYRQAFGFSQFAYAGLETGRRDSASYALEQGKARLVLTTAFDPDDPISDHVRRHGDGVRDIAFHVDDADAAFAEAVRRGATPVVEPRDLADANGAVRHAAVATYGDTIHSFLSYRDYRGPFLPGYAPRPVPGRDAGLLRIDHMVGNVELGKMNAWAEWYSRVLGFARYISFDDKDISTEYSALMSIVMSDDSYAIKFPINEPAAGRRKSQIEEYLDYYRGPGVQHIALLTGDIVATVTGLRENGVEFLSVPPSYYDALPSRVGEIDEAVATIRELGILVDRDEEGYLLQLFTKPVEDRPTLFFEIIQRKGSRGFGKGNFRALFESIEREQALRGNL